MVNTISLFYFLMDQLSRFYFAIFAVMFTVTKRKKGHFQIHTDLQGTCSEHVSHKIYAFTQSSKWEKNTFLDERLSDILMREECLYKSKNILNIQ